MINDFLTALFIVCVILTVLVIVQTVIYLRKDRNVRNSNSDSSSDSLNGEDV